VIETIKLVEYVELCDHNMWIDGNRLIVKNGKHLSSRLKREISNHKENIMFLIERGE